MRLLEAPGWWRARGAAGAPPVGQLGGHSGATLHRGEAEPGSTQPHLGGGMPEGAGQQPVSQRGSNWTVVQKQDICKEEQMSCSWRECELETYFDLLWNIGQLLLVSGHPGRQ